jgi:hypothetical protein
MALKLAVLASLPLAPQGAKAVVIQEFLVSGFATGSTDVVSAKATIDLTGGDLTITLQNTTPITLGPPQLLTGFDFTLLVNGTALTNLQLTAANAPATLNVLADGSVQNLGSKNLLSPPTWSLNSGTVNFLNFNPNAEYGIIGPATGGNYAGANGGIKDNAGHNPFIDQIASYKIELPGGAAIPSNIEFANVGFYFGTTFETFVPVPEPTSAMIFGLGLGVACLTSRLPRRAFRK